MAPGRNTTDDDAHPLRRAGLGMNYESAIDQQISRARADGTFDALPGAGKPLADDDQSLVPPELRAGFRMLKSAGFAPPWVEALRGLDEERQAIEVWLAAASRRWPSLSAADRQQLRSQHREKLKALNSQLLTFTLTVPPGVNQVPLLRIERELERLG